MGLITSHMRDMIFNEKIYFNFIELLFLSSGITMNKDPMKERCCANVIGIARVINMK